MSSSTASPSEWPFADPINALAITTKRVLYEGHPVLLVTHDDDGDWQILCGTTNDPADGLVVCLGDMYEKDSSLVHVSQADNKTVRRIVGGSAENLPVSIVVVSDKENWVSFVENALS